MKFKNSIAALAAMTIAFVTLEYLFYLFVDRPVAAYAASLDQTAHGLIEFFRHITDLGKSQWYLVPCGIVAIFCAFMSRGKNVVTAYRRLFAYIGARALFVFATIGISGIIADIAKPVFGRARPLLWLRDGVYGFAPVTTQGSLWNGMPSGHTATAFALGYSLCVFYPRLRILWIAYALMLGASRVMVDAHYLSDVVAGAALGWLTVQAFLNYGTILISKVIFPLTAQTAPPRIFP